MKTCYGLYRGKVSNIDDPEKRGRIKVICPEVIGANVESAWCDPCVTVAYDTGGDFCIPALDEYVWIAFIAGDPNKPVYLGGWWKKDTVPKETYDELDNYRIIKYSNDRIIMQEDYVLIEVEDKKTRATLTDEDILLEVGEKNTRAHLEEDTITLEVGELQSRIKMEGDNVILEIGDSDTEVRIESGEVYIKGNLHVDGEIYGTKSATLDVDVNAKNNVNAENNVNADNDVSASNNVSAGANVSAVSEVSGNNATFSSTDGGSITGTTLTANSISASQAIESNSVSATSVYANEYDLSNLIYHVHSAQVQGEMIYTSTPMDAPEEEE